MRYTPTCRQSHNTSATARRSGTRAHLHTALATHLQGPAAADAAAWLWLQGSRWCLSLPSSPHLRVHHLCPHQWHYAALSTPTHLHMCDKAATSVFTSLQMQLSRSERSISQSAHVVGKQQTQAAGLTAVQTTKHQADCGGVTAQLHVLLCTALTERARCRCAAALPPDGRMKFLRGGRLSSMLSSQACRQRNQTSQPQTVG